MIVIIDPVSTEFNRGSFCYLPYIFYSYLKSKGEEVVIYEDFTVTNIDSLPEYDKCFIALWSYPQIEQVKVLFRFLSKEPEFFGYYPLIESLGLPVHHINNDEIRVGIKEYFNYFEKFKYILLSDCDMHLNKYSGQVYPLFTSYGCPNGCTFCPSTINCDRKRIVLSAEEAFNSIKSCYNKGIRNIHFTDEDFFFNPKRAKDILEKVVKENIKMQFISLGHASKVVKFLDDYGEELLIESGMKLIEVGMETAYDNLADSMNKKGMKDCLRLAQAGLSIDIFWLSLTFFPGETIKSLNATGEFLREYGFRVGDLYSRIKTNSTEGGLGQFYQLYHGVENYDNYKNLGTIIDDRPVRLLPSFLPYSFLKSEFEVIRNYEEEDMKWFDLYKVSANEFIKGKNKVIDYIEGSKNNLEVSKKAIWLAVCARLGIIK